MPRREPLRAGVVGVGAKMGGMMARWLANPLNIGGRAAPLRPEAAVLWRVVLRPVPRSRREPLAQVRCSSRAPSIFFSRYSNWTVYIPEHIPA